MNASGFLRAVALLCLDIGLNGRVANAAQDSTFTEPSTVKDILDFLARLNKSTIKAQIAPKVDEKMKAYRNADGVYGPEVQKDIESVIDEICEIRAILLKHPNQYGKYSELTESDADASANFLFDWLVKDACGIYAKPDPLADDSQTEFPVYLKVYDMSYGIAEFISRPLLGYQLDGAWHTGLAVYGKEYIYADGICSYTEKRCEEVTEAKFVKRILLGNTKVPQEMFEAHLDSLAEVFSSPKYDFFDWNCHSLSNCGARYLTGKGIPEEYLNIAHNMRHSMIGRLMIAFTRTRSSVAVESYTMSSKLVSGDQPATLKDMLDFLGKLETSSIKERVIGMVHEKIKANLKAYLDTMGIRGLDIERNINVVLDRIPKLRQILLKDPNDYGKYSDVELSESDICGCADALASWFPVLQSDLWFLYFQTKDAAWNVGGGWRESLPPEPSTDKDALQNWLGDQVGAEAVQWFRKGCPGSESTFSIGDPAFYNNLITAFSRVNEGPLRKVLLGLLFHGRNDHSKAAHAVLFLYEICMIVRYDTEFREVFRRTYPDGSFHAWRNECDKLASLFEPPADMPEIRAVHQRKGSLYSDMSDPESINNYFAWLKSRFDCLQVLSQKVSPDPADGGMTTGIPAAVIATGVISAACALGIGDAML